MKRDIYYARLAVAQDRISQEIGVYHEPNRDPEIRLLTFMEDVAGVVENQSSEPDINDAEMKERLTEINGVGDKLADEIMKVIR